MEPEASMDIAEPKKKDRRRKRLLFSNIIRQMEFYFSDSNLSKDRFLSQLMQENPHIDLSLFLKFNKIRKLTTNLDDIKGAISKSKSELIALTEDGQSVYRKTPVREKPNVDECTIYVEKIKADATHEWVTSIFSDFGNVAYVSIPKYKQKTVNKGFAFVEYDTEEEAQKALAYFESIGCKMPSHTNPEELCSIVTHEKHENARKNRQEALSTDDTDTAEQSDEVSSTKRTKKRKHSDDVDQKVTKKIKSEENSVETECSSMMEDENQAPLETDGQQKKRKKKEQKRKNFIKELGLQILSKKEWKKMRNHYLDLQKSKMMEFKTHRNRMRFSQQTYKNDVMEVADQVAEVADVNSANSEPQITFTPGVIVKVKLLEPCNDPKKLKNDVKSGVPNVQYVDIPLPCGSQEIFIRFKDPDSAEAFTKQDGYGEKQVLCNEDEKQYWNKLENDRKVKYTKCARKKQRGRDKLLDKAKKEMAKHIKFDEDN